MVTDSYGRPYTLEQAKACVGKGWGPLIERLYRLCDQHNVCIAQIKEKFGGLRFYVTGAPNIVHQAILTAETESYGICEECGDVGEERPELSWVRTLCDSCLQEHITKV